MTEREDFERAGDEWIGRTLDHYRECEELLQHVERFRDGMYDAEDEDYDAEGWQRFTALLESHGYDLPEGDGDDLAESIREQNEGYGVDVRITARVALMGGGPEGWIELETDHERREWLRGRICYRDWFQTAHTRELDTEQVDMIARIMWAEDPSTLLGDY